MVSSRSRRNALGEAQKKSRRFRRLLKLITGRRQTEWTGATRCPKEDGGSHNRESLIDRKRAVSFRLCLPCRPLAELFFVIRRCHRASPLPPRSGGEGSGVGGVPTNSRFHTGIVFA